LKVFEVLEFASSKTLATLLAVCKGIVQNGKGGKVGESGTEEMEGMEKWGEGDWHIASAAAFR